MINLEVGPEGWENNVARGDSEEWERLAMKLAMLFWKTRKDKIRLIKKFINADKELIWILTRAPLSSARMILAVSEDGDCKIEFKTQIGEK